MEPTNHGPYAEQARIRALIAAVERDVVQVTQPGVGAESSAPASQLLASWAALVAFLGVGPEPEVRACPYCGNTIMATATRCRDCWRKLDR